MKPQYFGSGVNGFESEARNVAGKLVQAGRLSSCVVGGVLIALQDGALWWWLWAMGSESFLSASSELLQDPL